MNSLWKQVLTGFIIAILFSFFIHFCTDYDHVYHFEMYKNGKLIHKKTDAFANISNINYEWTDTIGDTTYYYYSNGTVLKRRKGPVTINKNKSKEVKKRSKWRKD